MAAGGSEFGIERGFAVSRFPILECGAPVFHLFVGRAVDGPGGTSASRRVLLPPPFSWDRVVRLRQVHGARVLHLTRGRGGPPAGETEADGAVTDLPGLLLRVRVADCLPVYLVDPKGPVIGLVHAGWRGLAEGVLEEAVERFREEGSPPERLLAAVGPSIGPCCYEVGGEVAARLGSEADPRPGPRGRPHVDLYRAASERLRSGGLAPEKIGARPACTSCRSDRLHSHRESGGRAGRNEAWLGILPQAEAGKVR
ncbi:MAG: peptidoglycan editing factor PgeF [Candidatus Eisenbacteria bacterium]